MPNPLKASLVRQSPGVSVRPPDHRNPKAAPIAPREPAQSLATRKSRCGNKEDLLILHQKVYLQVLIAGAGFARRRAIPNDRSLGFRSIRAAFWLKFEKAVNVGRCKTVEIAIPAYACGQPRVIRAMQMTDRTGKHHWAPTTRRDDSGWLVAAPILARHVSDSASLSLPGSATLTSNAIIRSPVEIPRGFRGTWPVSR